MCACMLQVTSSMAGVVKAMESAMKSMNLEKVVVISVVMVTNCVSRHMLTDIVTVAEYKNKGLFKQEPSHMGD